MKDKMNYQETLEYLYTSAPLFQQVGKDAYKEGLENTCTLDAYFGHPHLRFRSIHVGGTNGKGSCSHTLAAILQSAGYRVGLYTSPHLIDFRERIRVNGIPVDEDFVTTFVEEHRHFFEPLHPSFFELTTAMAFLYFARSEVDVAVIEVGLGGRLDCTNIICPDLSVITNISLDHVQFLGDTPAAIAAEKAGIIKEGVPVVIGETTPETRPVFLARATAMHAPIVFAEDEYSVQKAIPNPEGGFVYQTADYPDLKGELGGLCQEKNTATLLSALRQLRQSGYNFSGHDVRNGFAHVCGLTGLRGRWQRLPLPAPYAYGGGRTDAQEQSCKPAGTVTIVCDTGHNAGGMQYIAKQLSMQHCRQMHIVIGMTGDKDTNSMLTLLPDGAVYYFTQAGVKRALPADKLCRAAAVHGLHGKAYPTVRKAMEAALAAAEEGDFIFVGGSSFIVADLLSTCYP